MVEVSKSPYRDSISFELTSTFKTFIRELGSARSLDFLALKHFPIKQLEEAFEKRQYDQVLTKVLGGILKSTRRQEIPTSTKCNIIENKT